VITEGAFRTSREGVFAVGNVLHAVESAAAVGREGYGPRSTYAITWPGRPGRRRFRSWWPRPCAGSPRTGSRPR